MIKDSSEYIEVPVGNAQIYVAAYYMEKKKRLRLFASLFPFGTTFSARLVEIDDKYYLVNLNSHWIYYSFFPWKIGDKPSLAWEVEKEFVENNLYLYRNYADFLAAANGKDFEEKDGTRKKLEQDSVLDATILGRLVVAPLLAAIVTPLSYLLFGSYMVQAGINAEIIYIISSIFWFVFLYILVNFLFIGLLNKMNFGKSKQRYLCMLEVRSVSERNGYFFRILFYGLVVLGGAWLFSGIQWQSNFMPWWNIFYMAIITGAALINLRTSIIVALYPKGCLINSQESHRFSTPKEQVKLFIKKGEQK